MKNLLIIVDPQNDFITGSLAVPGAVKAMDSLVDILNEKRIEFSNIIVTIDFHPFNHCSFKENGGEWPPHCIQYTEGAAMYPLLANVLGKLKDIEKVFFEKGWSQHLEEYSAFGSLYGSEGLLHTMDEKYFDRIYVAGLAGDYCVFQTVQDIIELGFGDTVVLLLDGIASIDGGEKLSTLEVSRV